MTTDTLLTVVEVAKVLRVDVSTVRRILERGELKGVKVGNVWRVHAAKLRAYIGEEASDGR